MSLSVKVFAARRMRMNADPARCVWAAHPQAPWLLFVLSFFEAIFFPVPPEVMLAPMWLAQPQARILVSPR